MSNPPSNKTRFISPEVLDRIIRLGELSPTQPSIKDQCIRITTTAEELFSGCVHLWLNQEGFSSPRIGKGRNLEFNNYSACSPVMHTAINKRKVISSKFLSPDTGLTRYSITAPIYSGVNLLGVLSIERADNNFSGNEKKIFYGLITQAGITLAATQKHVIDRWSIDLLELVRNVSQQIIDIFDITDLFNRVTQLILDTFHYYYVAIYTADMDRQRLEYRSSAGPHRWEDQDHIQENNIKWINFGEGIVGQAAKSMSELLAQDVSACEYYRHIDGLPETKSEFAMPLIFNNNILGVLDVQSDEKNAFTEVDSLVLRALADHIAIAISNVHLYEDVNQRANHLSIVAEISKAISSILDFNHLLNNIVSLIHIRFSIPRVNLFTVHTGRRKIFYRAGAGQFASTEDFFLLDEFSYDLEPQQGLVPWAAIHHQTITVNNVSSDPRFVVTSASPATTSSEMVIPLVYGDQVLGILDLQSPAQNIFKPEDIYLYEMLADNISVAIRNANLYSSEQWRRQVSESIKEVAGLLSANIDLSDVLGRILIELHKSLPCDVSAIWLLDSYEPQHKSDELASSLTLAAIYPENEGLHELLITDGMHGSPGPWMLEAINSPMPLVRLPSHPYEPLGAYLNYPPEYSAIAAPLKANEQILGLIVLIHKNGGRYGSEAQAMTTTFANYSAVAINNTRLFEAAHDQAWVATVLLQVAEATQALSSVAELLETVVRIVPRLIGLKSCALFIWDEMTETFLPSASNGLDENQVEMFTTWHIAPGEFGTFDHILEDKSPMIIDWSSLSNGQDSSLEFHQFDIENGLWVLFPMVAQNNVRGAIMVNFALPEGYNLNSQDLFEEKYLIIQGIANQTAVALENIMLLQSQEEEAYTSVVLLQVAQAIVSLNNLDEIIGTIVRITPILVGVKRCVVYLIDLDQQEFYLSQSYGISKQELSELPEKYIYGEHQFLNSIQSSAYYVFRLLSEEEESPTLWDKYSNSDFLIAPAHIDNSDEAGVGIFDGEYLKYRGRILFGFPLSIKGKLLGAMIFEEGSNPKGTPSAHIRQRRLEIITGITHQTSLAIHNDLLQREVVIRERLEREMQLAREIQTTFLPESLPYIPGYDLDIHWRPARQVGGDFYDIVNYPDGRIGLIMADVADKGMPAALFMILVRTLIRAAVKDNLSPSEILKQVNELLVPDAKHGMFVTVIIAVLSPADGTIIYANAGHNPPIIHRLDKSLQEMLPTGMALGIFDQIALGEHMIKINRGERIIFYTDGVTEAFSETDEMYGVERLKTTIITSNDHTANGLLDSIENSLSGFLGGAPQSDDLTIAALIRK